MECVDKGPKRNTKHKLVMYKKYENIWKKQLFKNRGFDRNGRHHELSREKLCILVQEWSILGARRPISWTFSFLMFSFVKCTSPATSLAMRLKMSTSIKGSWALETWVLNHMYKFKLIKVIKKWSKNAFKKHQKTIKIH